MTRAAALLLVLMGLAAAAAEPKPSPPGSTWLLSDTVASLAFREKVSAALAAAATAQLEEGRPLAAGAAAHACLRIDRYRCSCIRDAGLAQAGLESVDATTKSAVEGMAWEALTEYVWCDETAPDAAKMISRAAKWAGRRQNPFPVPALTPEALRARGAAALLGEGNEVFPKIKLVAKRRFEVCAMLEPVLCACPKRAGDSWLALDDRERAIVWWSRYLDCSPDAADRALVEKDLTAAQTSLKENPIWQGVFSQPDSSFRAAPALAQTWTAAARQAVKDKRLDDALAGFTVCRLLDPDAFDCGLELASTLDQLDRRDDAARVRAFLLQELPAGDKRGALLRKQLAGPKRPAPKKRTDN